MWKGKHFGTGGEKKPIKLLRLQVNKSRNSFHFSLSSHPQPFSYVCHDLLNNIMMIKIFFIFMFPLVLLFPKLIWYFRKGKLLLLFTYCIPFNLRFHSFFLVSQIITTVNHCHYHYHCLRTRHQFLNAKKTLMYSFRQSISVLFCWVCSSFFIQRIG